MKPFKNILLLIGILVLSLKGYSQIPAFVYEVDMNQCFTYSTTPNSYSLDSITIVTPPANGTLTENDSVFVYCPNQDFVGSDTAHVFACIQGGGMLWGCDTVEIVFNVTNNCAVPVTLVQDSGICPGGNRSYMVIASGMAPYAYLWSDGSAAGSACELNPGMGICVTVTDANGCTGNACTSTNGCNLNAVITHSPNGCGAVGDALIANVTGGTAPYTYYWSNNSTNSTICGLTPGTYFLSVVDAQGCVTAATYTIQGTGGCSFTYSNNPVQTGEFYFSPYVDSLYVPVLWNWTFGDGTTSQQQDPTHVYTTPGYYNVIMFVSYSNGDSCSYSAYVYVADDSINFPACQAYFSNYLDANGTYHFVDYSSYNPISWLWSFGDGTSSTQQNPTHTYNSQGAFTVCLTTTDANGCSSNTCQQVSNIPVQDLQAFLYHQSSTTPGFPVWVYLGYYNAGTILMNGTLEYRYPAGTTVNATSQAPLSHDVANRLLTFSITGSVPGSSDYIYIDLQADANLPLGSLSEDTLWANPVAGDATPADNVALVQDTVTGSWDPNDKAVSPKGKGDFGIVPLETNVLSYRIRFQNTGTAPAHDVIIRDALSNHIDLSTVKVTAASHAHTFEMIGNQLVVSFANIMLPDSGADYEASQGYIDVRVKLKPNLALGTQVFNTAEIYFDFNEPVITNTVTNTLGQLVSGIEAIESLEFAMLPNPASTQVTVRGDFDKNATFELMNQLGQTLLTGPVNANNTTLNVADLSSGIYLVRIKNGTQSAVQKLVITR
ncbi:MAG TPA: PKD domain-containing protein [Chitinophagales bacterium]|nr:PKD domain-containing protein [Chitinophagales bacterium]